ncbi:MAG: GxxExxY protein [bacterium]
MENYLYSDESRQIIGACYEVHNQLGPGFLEQVYQEALMYEFFDRKIPSVKEKHLDVYYKERKLDKYYSADFTCFDKIIIEVKAKEALCDDHIAQVLNYLKATNYRLGLLVNFGTPKVQIRRIIL